VRASADPTPGSGEDDDSSALHTFLGVSHLARVKRRYHQGSLGQLGQRSGTAYARISASGKKMMLRMKYPRRLCSLRAATRAGQNTIAIQTDDAQNDQEQTMRISSGLIDNHHRRSAKRGPRPSG
jgi:hypothetical protein